MAIEGLNSEFLRAAAASQEPIVIERGSYEITIYVRRLEAWEIGEPDPPPDLNTHPLAIPAHRQRRVSA